MGDEQLLAVRADQRCEMEFRRGREQSIFAWSSAILVALTGWALVSRFEGTGLARVDERGVWFAVAGAFVFALCSVFWQLRQRDLMRQHQQILADTAVQLGWFDLKRVNGKPLLPDAWKNWGSRTGIAAVGLKVWATAGLGFLACIALALAATS